MDDILFLIKEESIEELQARYVENERELAEIKRENIEIKEYINKKDSLIEKHSEDLFSKDVVGTLYYCMNDTHAVKSTQTRASDFSTLLPGFNTQTDPIPQNIGTLNITDPANISMNYYYISPFIYSYDPKANFLRAYAMGQYDVPYLSFSTFESYTNSSAVRFINTSIRVNDYIDFTDNSRTALIKVGE